jgi:hypothetical protein
MWLATQSYSQASRLLFTHLNTPMEVSEKGMLALTDCQ